MEVVAHIRNDMKFNLEKALKAIADYEMGDFASKYVYQTKDESGIASFSLPLNSLMKRRKSAS